MIVILKENPDQKQLESFKSWITDKGISIHESQGTTERILGLVGDTTQIDIDLISALDIVADVRRIQEPYKNANRKFHPNNTVVDVNGIKIGEGELVLMAGPCSVESEDQVCEIAEAVKKAGAKILRGGAFKPRTSPYSFQGLRAEGIEFLLKAKEATGLPIVTEIMDISQLDCFQDVDIIQIGARNMQNFELLKQIGRTNKPILLKRGLSATYEELLMSAEYIMAEGNNNVILCERGIRTFETYTRNTLDVASVPALKKLSHLPVIVDPSHSGGRYDLVEPLSLASVAAGADGLIVEVHNDPEHALCDGPQSLRPEAFAELSKKVFAVHSVISGK